MCTISVTRLGTSLGPMGCMSGESWARILAMSSFACARRVRSCAWAGSSSSSSSPSGSASVGGGTRFAAGSAFQRAEKAAPVVSFSHGTAQSGVACTSVALASLIRTRIDSVCGGSGTPHSLGGVRRAPAGGEVTKKWR